MKKVFTSIFLLALSLNIMAQQAIITKQKGRTKYIKHKMETMTLKQMVGQMIMIDSYAKDDSNYYKNVLYQIDSNEVGGVCFFKGTQKELVKLNKIYNQHSKIPLLVAIDGEWGMNMRLTDAETFPVAMTLGALPKDKYHLVRDMAEVMAKQCKDMGIHINFAPVVDVNI
ncbi:MAG: glycoside hydrolase family 3 N-terminal domain-containing protein, partial [Synergistales bacterium]|nr:glycoside hydrolase family 3 N-terminal domain-containing protein [Bacteroidales bacterium]MDY6435651.1 glycoside hydrolase family 3 N-terminal domain-containing protein [Synergistales bacterium]